MTISQKRHTHRASEAAHRIRNRYKFSFVTVNGFIFFNIADGRHCSFGNRAVCIVLFAPFFSVFSSVQALCSCAQIKEFLSSYKPYL